MLKPTSWKTLLSGRSVVRDRMSSTQNGMNDSMKTVNCRLIDLMAASSGGLANFFILLPVKRKTPPQTRMRGTDAAMSMMAEKS